MKIIGILTAMDCETEAIVNCLQDVKQMQYGPTTFYEGSIDNHRVIVALCGVGKVSSAMNATLMINHYPLDALVNIGTAGGLQTYENVLDVVIATQVCEYDMDVIDWGKGYGNPKTCTFLDESLIEKCKDVFKDNDYAVYYGPIATGDVFVCKDNHISNIVSHYPESLACEMEGGAIAKVAKAFNIPCLVIRSLSDIAIKEGNEIQFEQYMVLASQRAAQWTEALIKVL